MDELEKIEAKAKEKKMTDKDLHNVKELCEALYAIEEVNEIWHKHKSDEHVREHGNPDGMMHNPYPNPMHGQVIPNVYEQYPATHATQVHDAAKQPKVY